MSPALAGILFTTEPPGKSYHTATKCQKQDSAFLCETITFFKFCYFKVLLMKFPSIQKSWKKNSTITQTSTRRLQQLLTFAVLVSFIYWSSCWAQVPFPLFLSRASCFCLTDVTSFHISLVIRNSFCRVFIWFFSYSLNYTFFKKPFFVILFSNVSWIQSSGSSYEWARRKAD